MKQLNQMDWYDRLRYLFSMKYNAEKLSERKLGLKISNTKPHALELVESLAYIFINSFCKS